ncbi:adenylyl-sulfate kinase [Conexibacter sp. CPCC 206217]|uniref:adenylyl-sulfate kinase n=1 Tax=Conexibacter sp. CPCC 206217 TaxID=3064574 RepID=UPI00271BAD0F|nr:adenylyl-sulfate kinase [Conexibacter sp. CPCC 206217]MDO8212327.1 adenylyl-sulfate kinase [Conexibacter sp. CPCC 206217]
MSEPRELLRLATAGSVDDGKSTLLGRLLLDTKLLLSDQLEAVSGSNGDGPDLAALTDGLRAEREQGITIDVAYRFFATPRRSFILADTPGHERYTRNMFTGASTADLAIVLVDARHGVVTQTRRHTQISALLGIRHVVTCVNKMDLVGWDRDRFDAVAADVRELAERLRIADPLVLPISALHGDNVVDRSPHTPWYDGPPLLEHLEQVDVAADRDLARLRLPIQWVARPAGSRRRGYAGQLAAGTLRAGDPVIVMPAGTRTTVTAVDTLDDAAGGGAATAGASGAADGASAASSDGAVAVPPLSVTVELADDIDVGRGDVLVSPGSEPPAARELEATICWMAQEPLRPGRRYALKHTTRTVRATVQALHERIDPETLLAEREPAALALNDIGRVTLRTSSVVLADPYAENRVTGAFVLIDEHDNDTVAAGLVLSAREVKPPREGRRDVTWHPSALDRGHRWTALGNRGATVWLTGLPASGKSTIAVELERALVESGQPAYLLDGDNIRYGLSDDLGFSPGDRAEHIRRVGHVARLIADSGTVAVVSLVSPMEADRAAVRELHDAAGLAFVEVFVDTSVQECARRDPKGLYARARAGEIKGFTGVDAPYERPQTPELHVPTAEIDVAPAVARIVELVRAA